MTAPGPKKRVSHAAEWRFSVKQTKRLLIFATPKVVASVWDPVLTASIGEFNRISTNQSLGVTFVRTNQPPEPDVSGAADVQVDLGNGIMSFRLNGQDFVVKDKTTGQPEIFDPFKMHGATVPVSTGGLRFKAMIYLPESPRIKEGGRLCGEAVMKFIAVHELVHATGPTDEDHNFPGVNADVFTTGIAPFEGQTPSEDKVQVDSSSAKVRFAPPIELKEPISTMIREKWN